jgi:hypothetical protein
VISVIAWCIICWAFVELVPHKETLDFKMGILWGAVAIVLALELAKRLVPFAGDLVTGRGFHWW